MVTRSAHARSRVLDAFDTVAGWTGHPSEGVELRISRDSGYTGSAMRLDYDFRGGSGYAIARKAVALDLPANYEFSFRVKGNASPNDLERESDSSLVVGAGLHPDWVREEPGVAIEGLRTHYGALDVRIQRAGRDISVKLGGSARVPPGGIVVSAPLAERAAGVTVGGLRAKPGADGEIRIKRLPAEVIFSYRAQ
ncbi:MAG: hypothetical protein ACR2G6_14350 [Gemmatimonadaceae bacterium]